MVLRHVELSVFERNIFGLSTGRSRINGTGKQKIQITRETKGNLKKHVLFISDHNVNMAVDKEFVMLTEILIYKND
jgi:hypothetical protein